MKKEAENKKHTNEKPVSLYPLEPEEAIRRLLQVKPQAKKKKRKPMRSRA
ncbi:MAG: hypothetical protein KF749_09420 [Bacteroidetes bacterium]|nr:hypothetical protein [Bacteroidota bacterium]MCW5894844.1 hypothetical protein [Bacteroidota bacterium]